MAWSVQKVLLSRGQETRVAEAEGERVTTDKELEGMGEIGQGMVRVLPLSVSLTVEVRKVLEVTMVGWRGPVSVGRASVGRTVTGSGSR